MKRQIGYLLVSSLLVGCTAVKQVPAKAELPKVRATSAATSQHSGAEEISPLTKIELGKTGIAAPTIQQAEVVGVARMEKLQGEGLNALSESDSLPFFEAFSVADPVPHFNGGEFQRLMPRSEVRVGEVFKLEPQVFETFLKPIHPNVITALDRDGSGAYGLLRAFNEETLEFIYRVHAQFVIADDVIVSPAQFDGTLRVNRKTGAVESFSFEVPTTHQKNVNFEVQRDDFLVGMVFTSQMEVASRSAPDGLSNWTESVEVAGGRKALAERFFAFESIHWRSLPEALEVARQQKKPIFAIVIEGVLNDQSC